MDSCATCQTPRMAGIEIDRCGVPHGHPGHRVVYRWTRVVVCLRCDTGRLISFDHDCFTPPWEERWDVSWQWPIDAGGPRRLWAALAVCPAPTRAACDCPAHRSLRASIQQSVTSAAAVTVDVTPEGLPHLLFVTPPRDGSPG